MAKLTVGHPFRQLAATLRVWGPRLDPDRVAKLLGCEGSSKSRAGQPQPDRGGRIAKLGMWRLESDRGPNASLSEHVRRILEQISPDSSPWHSDLMGVDRDMFVGGWLSHWNTSFSIDSDLLLELGSRGIPITFDLYADEDEDDNEEQVLPTATDG